jgi:6-phosphofructokinase 2
MSLVATLTMNPALDLSTTTNRVEHTHKLRCGPARYDPGGGGINVARVIRVLGGEVIAIFPAGGLIGEILQARLNTLDVPQSVIPISGTTRESFTVDEIETGKQYRFVLPGPTLLDLEQRQCLETLATLSPQPTYLVVSGSLPPGLEPVQFSSEITKVSKRIGVRLVLDSPLLMQSAPAGSVFLMKPSAREMWEMFGRAINSRAEQVEAARSIIRENRAEIVVVSLGADGALLVTDNFEEQFRSPDVPIHSGVGAGDSMLGAIVFALARGSTVRNAVRYGLAAGAAAIMNPGTELCHREDVERLFESMREHADTASSQKTEVTSTSLDTQSDGND